MIYRVMYDTESMHAGSDYMEMAHCWGCRTAGEAAAVIDKAWRPESSPAKGQDRARALSNS